jgi:membrane associated rhomboid family serine protease
MDEPAGIVSVIIIAATVLASLKGFSNPVFFERRIFHVESILVHRETDRIITSGFLHANWPHLLLNMFALYSFGEAAGEAFGLIGYILIYFGSLVAGSLLALYIRRDDGQYRAVGASGAVSGVIFSSIVGFPASSVTFLFFPAVIPAWLFGVGFVLISILGIRSRAGNIGHDAHLGGAIAGVCIGLMLRPELLAAHPLVVASIVLPAALFLLVTVKRPALLGLRDSIERRRGVSAGEREEGRRRRLEEEMDRLLDRVNERGIGGLSGRERERLRRIVEEKKRMRH